MAVISVMMPTYNAENYIVAALDSILQQDYPDLQVVVSDDASSDGTQAIIRQYAERYPSKITAIYNQTNLGVTRNCNLALSHCTGTYISLFAGDDIMLPGKLSRQVALMESDPECVLCYHPVEIFDSATDKTLFVTNQHPREDVYTCQDLLLKGGIPGGCSIVLRRSALPEGGYDSRLKTVSDWLFFLEISLKGRLRKLDAVLARYRKHAGGASRQTYELLAESLFALDLFEQKHPERHDLQPFIRQAKARYVAGEAFRQLSTDPALALRLSRDVLGFQASGKYRLLQGVAWCNCHVPGARFVLAGVTTRLKYFLKRIAG
ncbi:putative glycosyltransferase EpsE [Pseudomonas reidholzensis]|uniref:Putative glycosyltransferase EpsE n=1 Tax=Pseudomonas reidholzensis TaxID=1785162 RepID=A0A383RQT2_9PSED|nr:glycosyltransferase [Pseudomonas reidholzensis]SYX89427.1 putative glycosyltransferase EpsE [Pseudomonas reidholzensis]